MRDRLADQFRNPAQRPDRSPNFEEDNLTSDLFSLVPIRAYADERVEWLRGEQTRAREAGEAARERQRSAESAYLDAVIEAKRLADLLSESDAP
jgi:hypothetical protein